MDLIYLSDVMAYQSIRGPIYDKYDQKWDVNDQKGNQQRQRSDNGRNKKPCKICQERQRRSLMTYIRSKSHESCGEDQIIEEEEEAETQAKESTVQDKKEDAQN